MSQGFKRSCKNIAKTCCFGYFGYALSWPPKRMVSASRKVWFLSSCKKLPLTLPLIMAYLFLPKILQLCYFGYFRYAWPLTPKQKYLSVGNFRAYFTSFLKYYTFANSQYDWPWVFWLTTWEREFCQIRGLQWNIWLYRVAFWIISKKN